ncbi:MAG: hypothetical protein ABSC17_04995 [Thermacetogeniaceae bacterium]
MPDLAPDLLTTAQVCRELGITPHDVHRLEAEGYLESRLLARNKHGDIPLFSGQQVASVRLKLPRILRNWDDSAGAAGGAAAARKRQHDWDTSRHTIARKEQFLKAMAEIPERSAVLLRAAYYLFHLNHYAKSGETYLYDLKERVLAALASRFTRDDGLQIYFIPGPARVRLCPDCRIRAQEQRKSYLEYARLTGGCQNCQRDEDYFSLYEFLIAWDQHRFCFHSPFQIARKWLKDRDVPIKEGSEREGAYPFGRPISSGEATAVNLAEVVDELERFLDANRLFDPDAGLP